MVFEKDFGNLNYTSRSKKAYLIAISAGALSILLTLRSGVAFSFLFGFFIFMVFAYKGLSSIRFYINQISIDNTYCRINFQEKGIAKKIEASSVDFKIKKVFLFVKGRAPVLKIRNKMLNIYIKQHALKNWKEDDMNLVISNLKK